MAKEVQVVWAMWECSDCRGEREFVQPECVDGHGLDCPEWACRDCGAAILIGSVHIEEPQERRELRGAA